jgi:hypothetical protein
MSRFAATATTTVRRLAFSGWVAAPLEARPTGLGGLHVAGNSVQVGDLNGQWIRNRHCLFLDISPWPGRPRRRRSAASRGSTPPAALSTTLVEDLVPSLVVIVPMGGALLIVAGDEQTARCDHDRSSSVRDLHCHR